MKNKLINQDPSLPSAPNFKGIQATKNQTFRRILNNVIEKEASPVNQQRMKEKTLKGTSHWMNALPMKVMGQYLNKSEYQDAMRMRFGIKPENIPDFCACRKPFTVTHSQVCPKGGYIIMRHDKIKNYLFKKVSQIYKDTQIEPKLHPVGEENLAVGTDLTEGARSDIRIRGMHREFQNTFIDVKVTNVCADTYAHQSPNETLKKSEETKERKYKDRIQKVENGIFIPAIFSCNGARAPQTKILLAKIITKISLKKKEPRYIIANRMATQLSFMFVKQSLICLRGNRNPLNAELL